VYDVKCSYSAFESTLNSLYRIVSYRMTWNLTVLMAVIVVCLACILMSLL